MKLQGEHLQHQEGVKFSECCNLNTITGITSTLLPLSLEAHAKLGWRRENEEENGYLEELGKTPSSAVLAFSHKILHL